MKIKIYAVLLTGKINASATAGLLRLNDCISSDFVHFISSPYRVKQMLL